VSVIVAGKNKKTAWALVQANTRKTGAPRPRLHACS
jgi:hypothetical protein